MEIFGGFMVLMSFIGLFLAVVWLIMPFVVFAIKGKQDRTLEVLEGIDKRLAGIEARLKALEPVAILTEYPPLQPSDELPTASTVPTATAPFAENI
ncbi:MAG: hypothetical protein HY888_07030 [Deltaproteobacteria bacterium]|nr:hypothetical protein [Deltaproteobacteria bacterium]